MYKRLVIRLIVIIATIQLCNAKESKCTAGVVFLKTFPTVIDPRNPETYTLDLSYPCDASPLAKIEKLKRSVRDPFVSFHLKPRKHSKRALAGSEFGSGGDYDDDDDDGDDGDDEEEEVIEPSNHVIPNLPTPTLDSSINYVHVTNTYESPVFTSSYQPVVAPTKSLQVIRSSVVSEDKLIFPILGSGDGPVVMTTPIFNPSTTTDSDDYVVISSSYPTPPLVQTKFHLLHPIPKQLIYSGVPHNYSIPGNTFQPPCSSYELAQPEPWVHIRNSNVLFFPTTEHISDYNLAVVCSENRNSVAELFVSVRQRQKSRLYNHEFKIEFGMIRGNYSKVENLVRVVDNINEQVNMNGKTNMSTGDLVVVSTELDSYPFRITYVNESVISNVCPVAELKRIYDSLSGLGGVIKLESVKIQIPADNNQCDNSVVPGITGQVESGGERITYGENFPPSIKNQIDRLNGTVGEYLLYNVKEDFCYDPEDGGTRNLNVMLRNSDLADVGEGNWIQFDEKNQEFFGLPMAEEHREYVLVCADKHGKKANDVLELQISTPKTPLTDYNTEFSLHFQSIPFTPKAIRKFMEKLSSILSPHIQVHSYSESNNHVLFKWFNTTNPSTEHQVTEIRKVLLSDDGPVNKRLYEHFSPEFNISVASVIPLRGLLSENNPVGGGLDDGAGGGDRYFTFGEEPPGGMGASGNNGDNFVVLDTYSGYLTTYIIPSVLIAVMILLALIIACLLSRKNKYTQASTEEDNPNSQAYLKNAKKGVPVIFQDELDEKLFGSGGSNRRNDPSGNSNIYEPPQQQQPRTHGRSPGFQTSTPPPSSNPPRYHHNTPTPSSGTPQPPDYQNSISRSMRNRSAPPGGPQQQYNNIDSYAPPPGINYYGIHNSNSGGFSDRGSSLHHHPHHQHYPSGYGQPSGGGTSNKMPPPPYVPP